MNGNLLLELEPTAPVTGALENIDDLLRVIVRDMTLAVEGMKGSACVFETSWRRVIMDVARGQTTEIHSARSRFLSVFLKRLDQLKRTHLLAIWLRGLGREDVPDPAVLLQDISGMERLKTTVFDLWQTAENLEELAARDYPLTTEDLDKIGPQHRPPASFYAKESIVSSTAT
jgi:hypothetical protein